MTKKEKEARKNRRLIFRKTMVVGVTPIILSAALIIMFLSVWECHDAFVTGQDSIAYDEAGEVIIPSEEDFSEFVFRGRMSFVARGLAFVGFFVFRLCRTGWPVRPAYNLIVSATWLLIAAIVFMAWLAKWLAARRVIKTSMTRLGLERSEYAEVRRLCRITIQDIVFVAFALLGSVFQIVLIPARFMMTPVLILAIGFLVAEVIRQALNYYWNRQDAEAEALEESAGQETEATDESPQRKSAARWTQTEANLSLKDRIRRSEIYRRFWRWKIQNF